MRRVCAPPRTDSLTHQHDLDCDFARVLRKLSRGSQRSFSSLSFWHYFQVLVQNFLRLRRASVNFLSRLGPGSSPGRAESQLASELGELPLLGPQRAAVQQLPWPTAAATGTGTGNAAGEHSRCSRQAQRAPAQLCRRHGSSSRGDDATAAVPPPPLDVVCAVATVVAVKLLSVGVSSSVSGVHTHAEKLRQMSGRGGRSWPAGDHTFQLKIVN